MRFIHGLLFLCCLFMTACNDQSWNNPYPNKDKFSNIYYTSFTESPKTLDPALSYSANEAIFTAQIYEPPLQYHYLKRPYLLIPLTATQVPKPIYQDASGKILPDTAPANVIAYSIYEIHIQPGIYYQPHPAFAKRADGHYRYSSITDRELAAIYTLRDFKETGTRELIAEDYVYQIKRLAQPKHVSPILGLMSDHIVGLSEYAETLRKAYARQDSEAFLDLRRFPLEGVEIIDRYTYRIKLKGKYQQFIYWLAMPFFAPMPWEADQFYSQESLKDRNITLGWYPVGTGPYMLIENNPNRQMVLERNPNFHPEFYPSEGDFGDEEQGLLNDKGKRLPFIDKFIFTLEKESIPRWNKFLQGYYDQSSISADSFDQVIQIDEKGRPYLTHEMQKRGIRLQTSAESSDFYMGFNMLDEVIGDTNQGRKLRQAIAIAVDFEEFIAIFLNGRGLPAQGPIPPGISGYVTGQLGINPYIYSWENGRAVRRPLSDAKRLLAEAGYPNGRNPKTGEALVLNYDIPTTNNQEQAATLAWMRKQFAKLGIDLQIRDTQYNRFQEKMRTGNTQIYFWGWMADYPDPENFLFLLYGPNGKVKHGGENTSNYQNKDYDALFDEMKNLPDSPKRQKVIDHMLSILWRDTPWAWGYYPRSFALSHQWVRINKPGEMINNNLKYMRINPISRAQYRQEWNQPIVWPLSILLLVIVIATVPIFIKYWRRRHLPKKLL